MPGVRRRLADARKKVSGALASVLTDEDETASPAEPENPAEAPVPPSAEPPLEQPDPGPAGSTTEDPLDTPVLDPLLPAAAGGAGAGAGGAGAGAGGALAGAAGAGAGAGGAGAGGAGAGGAAAGPGAERVPATAAPVLDPVVAAAVEVARSAAELDAGTAVGEHLGVEAEPGEGAAATHLFASVDRAYVGWRWAVTLARADGSEGVTVDEVVLLPGPEALLAPVWVPWSDRLQPGDLSPGDLLPTTPDDHRLVPSYADTGAERLPFDLHRELGLGRPRVLSTDGRAEAAERWIEGEAGPSTPRAKAAPASCASCGFLVPLAGALGTLFGACANAMATDDGRVVALTHGCGAHSETVVEPPDEVALRSGEDDDLLLVEPDAHQGATA